MKNNIHNITNNNHQRDISNSLHIALKTLLNFFILYFLCNNAFANDQNTISIDNSNIQSSHLNQASYELKQQYLNNQKSINNTLKSNQIKKINISQKIEEKASPNDILKVNKTTDTDPINLSTNSNGTSKYNQSSENPVITNNKNDIEDNKDVENPNIINNKHLANKTCSKIITLSPEITEITSAIVESEKIKAVDINSNYPEFVQNLPKVADFYTVFMEQLLTIDYDCIFLDDNFSSKNLLFLEKKLENKNKTIIKFNLKSISDLFSAIDTIAALTQKQTIKLKNNLNEIIAQQKSKYTDDYQEPVMMTVWSSPIIAVGSNNHLNEFIQICGSHNVYSNLDGYKVISLESIFNKKPMAILNLTEVPIDLPKTLSSTKIKQVNILDIDNLVRLTPRSIIEGLPKICKIINANTTTLPSD